jgi:AcrR family transcriptional regulator
MKKSELREPIQKRAIEKKQHILEQGFHIICEKGYHNVDCIAIAKASNVSTGTVYQYFKDKRDIFLQGLKNYADSLLFPILEYKNKAIKADGLSTFFKKVIKSNVSIHTMSQAAHEEIMAMRHSDKEVNQIFQNFEIEATNVLVDILTTNHFETKDIYEKAHLIIGWIDNLCHELAYHKHSDLNYNHMTNIVVNSIVQLLN